jgi:hypothetical protein
MQRPSLRFFQIELAAFAIARRTKTYLTGRIVDTGWLAS